jgi:predicted metal-dependent hydrolase
MNHFCYYNDNLIEYELTYKSIKRVNIRIKGGKVKVTAPKKVSIKFIESVIVKNGSFILNAKLKQSENKSEFYYLGKLLRKIVLESNADKVSITDGEFIVYLKTGSDEKTVIKKFLLSESKKILKQIVDKAYLKFTNYNIPYPKISYKNMSTRWGSCNKKDAKINLNTSLILAPIDCIEYVVMHELSHLIELNHSKKFYAVLSSVFPNYKEKREKLKKGNYLYY